MQVGMRSDPTDEFLMRECFSLAERGSGCVSPNPMVGCVLVRKGRIVARGYHSRFGYAHAEVECLRTYRGDTRDTTLYVNLEPCSHIGKTPPCTDLLIQRGIPAVVVAMKDPNPIVSGKGIAVLRSAGVDVKVGILEKEARELNRFFVKHIVARMPYVHVKIAQTLDGRISSGGSSARTRRYITSKESLTQVHAWRTEYDAVLVGARTILDDNPRLDVRFVKGRNPAVVVLDGQLGVSGNERVFGMAKARAVIVCTTSKAAATQPRKVELLRRTGTRVVEFPSRKSSIAVQEILKALYALNIGSVLVEGGSHVFSEFVEAELIDELSLFIAPKIFGHGIPAFTQQIRIDAGRGLHFSAATTKKVGDDILIHLSGS